MPATRTVRASDECEPDVDGEPLLGSPEVEFNYRGVPERRGHINQDHWSDGHTDAQFDDGDREHVDEDGGDIQSEPHDDSVQDLEPDEADREPTLGAPENHHNQSRWVQGEDGELSLGAPENADQTCWAQGRKGSVERDLDEVPDYTNFRPKRRAAREAARDQARALVDKRRKRVLPKSDVVILQPGVALVRRPW